jgi:RNA recognition motif-containing protein
MPVYPRPHRMVVDEDNKPRGYAFVEFEREQDMKTAYKRADGEGPCLGRAHPSFPVHVGAHPLVGCRG